LTGRKYHPEEEEREGHFRIIKKKKVKGKEAKKLGSHKNFESEAVTGVKKEKKMYNTCDRRRGGRGQSTRWCTIAV